MQLMTQCATLLNCFDRVNTQSIRIHEQFFHFYFLRFSADLITFVTIFEQQLHLLTATNNLS